MFLSIFFAKYITLFQKLSNFIISGQNLLRQARKCIKMALPVTRIDVCVGDRIPAMDHHPISHVDPHMACAAGVIGPLEENQVPRPCVPA